jgi:hypothetical protein
MEMGKEMLHQEGAFNIKAGMRHGTDRVPGWMRTELSHSPYADLMFHRKRRIIFPISDFHKLEDRLSSSSMIRRDQENWERGD